MKTDVVILGAGIGGYETFRTLSKLLKRYRLKKIITLIDQHNYFTFTPMHHEAAAGSIEPDHCTVPLRELVYKTPHTFLKARVKKILPEEKKVVTTEGIINYDYGVVALGSTVNYFGTPGAKEYTHHVRDLPSAMKLQRKFIAHLEDKHPDIHMTIVGGGPTGVEMAGQFACFVKKDIKKLYPEKNVSIHLLEGGLRLLGRLPAKMGALAEKKLRAYNVSIQTNARVKEVTERAVILKDGTTVPATLSIWTAGFHNIANDFLDPAYCLDSRIPVTPHLNHEQAHTLYAVGDITRACNPKRTEPQPQLAEAAHKQGEYVAKHIVAMIRKKTVQPFTFHSMGTLMPIGDWYGIGKLGPFIVKGRFVWWLRRTVFLHFMPRVIRKLRIVFDWTIHSLGFRYVLDLDEHEITKN